LRQLVGVLLALTQFQVLIAALTVVLVNTAEFVAVRQHFAFAQPVKFDAVAA